jgi:glycosyltransferase involved in cell wall biosynthesis
LRWLAERGRLTVAVPESGPVASRYAGFSEVVTFPYEPLMLRGAPASRRAVAFRDDVRRFRALIRSSSAKLVIQATASLPAVLVAARLEGVPAIVYVGELFADPYAARRGRALLWPILARFVARTAAGVIACSDRVATQFRDAATVQAILGPVDEAPRADRDAARRRWGVPPDAPCVVAVGSLSEGRGQDVLLRALVRLKSRYPGIRSLIFGVPHPRPQDLAYEARLEGLTRELDLADTVSFCGSVDDVETAYAAADVVVNPARSEAFGRVAFEAALADRASVITGVGAAGHYLRDEEHALVVPPEDSAGLAEAVARLIDDPALRARLAEATARFAREEMGPERAVERFAWLVRQVQGGPRPSIVSP